MAQTSFALMTTLGRAKEAAALANATTITITHIAIGDGTTVPSGGETALYHEVARKTISGHGTVVGADNVAYFDCFLAAEDGPYTIREAGLIDDDGDMIAIAKYDPPISKPIPSSGQTVEGTVRLEVAFSDIANVTIKVDPAMKVALQRLTRLPWVPVISMSLASPPASPAVGDAYVVAAGATGSWVGQAGKVAEYTVAGWAIITPPDGHGVGLPDGRLFVRIAGAYVELAATAARRGLIKLATLPEAQAGADAEKAITPATIPWATAAEVADQMVERRAIDPKRLSGAIADLLGYDNLIVNPLFRINQDGFAGGAVAAGQYAIDMWGSSARTDSNMSFSGGQATIVSGAMKQVVENPGAALGQVTLHWEGNAACSINGAASAPSPITFNHAVAGNITLEFIGGTVRRPMMAPGAKPIPFRAPSLVVDKLNCYRYYYVNTDDLDMYVPTNLPSSSPWGLRYYLAFPVSMRVRPAVTLTSYVLGDRSSGTPSPRPDYSGLTVRVNVAAGAGLVSIANLRYKADARIAL